MDWQRVTSEVELRRLGAYDIVKEEINYDIAPILKAKSRSWKELYDYVSALQDVSTYILSDELKELGQLRRKQLQDKTPTYFKSYADEYLFYLLELKGTTRLKKLKVTKSMYTDSCKARCWYLAIVQVIHPDVLAHEKAAEAFQVLNELYEEMLKAD